MTPRPSTVTAGARTIGDGHPAFLVAEVGINHNGDVELARRTIAAAAEAGADAVKFQNYRTEDFITDRSLTYEYVSQGKAVVESQWDMFKRCELHGAALAELKAAADDAGVEFFSTPTGPEGVQELEDLAVPLLKNGSDFLTNLPLIERMAQSGIPTVISTGMATAADVDDAVNAFERAGGRELIVLQCTSAYPAPAKDIHLRQIPALREAFGHLVGFSDHAEGIVATVGAVAMGACFVEKHFTLDKGLPGPDHRFSADPAEFAQLVEAVRALEASLGDSAIRPTAAEADARQSYRLSCLAARDLRAGETIAADAVVFGRPGTGMPPKGLRWIVGRTLAVDVRAGEPFLPEHLS